MPKTSDISSKRLISLDPQAWARWALGRDDLTDCEILSGEFQLLSRDTDTLMRVAAPLLGNFLILFEIQLRYTKAMPRRLRAYAALAEEKYQLPVYVILVNIRRVADETEIAHRYESTFLGQHARQDYHVINLWEIPCQEVLALDLPTLLPFVPAMLGGDTQEVVREALEKLRGSVQLQEDERLKDMALAMLSFARYTLSDEDLQNVVRWSNMLNIVRESPLYQDIIREGMREGMREGLREGLQKGQEQESRAIVTRILTRRFGPLGEPIRERINQLPLSRAEDLAEALFDFTGLTDVETWLGTEQIN